MQSNEKYDKIIFFSIGVLFFSWFIHINKYQIGNFYQNVLDNVLKEEFEGVVIYKGNDKQNHKSLFIILKNQNQKNLCL